MARKIVLVMGLLLLFVLPAQANTWQRLEIDADCQGYTVVATLTGWNDAKEDLPRVYFQIYLRNLDNPSVLPLIVNDWIKDADWQDLGGGNLRGTKSGTWTLGCDAWQIVGQEGGVQYSWGELYVDPAPPYPGAPDPPPYSTNFYETIWGLPVTVSCPCELDEICRTPGYWGTHGGVITRLGLLPLTVCGKPISQVLPINAATSSLEAICVSPQGDKTLQLARQLTAAALNCAMFGAAGCGGSSIESLFSACNATCVGDPLATLTVQQCIDQVDCWNNGGQWNGMSCTMGTCSTNGEPCAADDECGDGTCLPFPDSCHERDIPGGDQSADTSNECNDARKNTCTIFSCTSGKR